MLLAIKGIYTHVLVSASYSCKCEDVRRGSQYFNDQTFVFRDRQRDCQHVRCPVQRVSGLHEEDPRDQPDEM